MTMQMSHFGAKSAALVIILAAVPAIAAKPVQTSMDRDPKLAQAEAAANRIVEHFHQTLKFDAVFFNDEFVSDPGLISRALSLDDEDKWKQFDVPTRERLYVAMMTWLHLWAEYPMIQKEHDVPPEFEKRNREPSLFSKSNPPRTISELNKDVAELEQMSAVYRKYFPSGIFQGEQYRKSIKQGVDYVESHSRNVPRIEKGNAKFGILGSVPVYIVRPEAFDYYFIEEKGGMKLFYVNIMPDFRLF
jgi:hypothetical protein